MESVKVVETVVRLPVVSDEEIWADEWSVVRAKCGDPSSSECASCGGCDAAKSMYIGP
jgi:hypothetical protein